MRYNQTRAVLALLLFAFVSTQDEMTEKFPVDTIGDAPLDKYELNKIISKKCFVKKGLTWKLHHHNCSNGLDKVGCSGCNPYVGDTICYNRRPILCIYKAKMPRPSYQIDCSSYAMSSEFYCGWTGGFLKLTKPIRGCHLESKGHADKICKAFFGDCWEMASHHDGYYIKGMNEVNNTYCAWDWSKALSGGWGYFAQSNLNTKSRFWTHIKDQPGNCWN